MTDRRRPWWNVRRPAGMFLWTAAFLVFAGFLVPLINANRFRRQIQTALEQALGRRVEIGRITLRLLPAPGFQMDNVVVGEDPAFGLEHFAFMSSMQARLRLRTLWTGQVQLASLILEEPSINLVKNVHGRWNFENLMQRVSAGAGGYSPYIGIDEGRVNFKFGEDKSVFHFQEVEAAVSPPRDAGGRWWIRFAGRPARTDHVLGGMGRLRGQGSVVPAPFPALNLELALDESPLSYLLRLAQGRDYGVHGSAGARVRLSGEPARVRIDGSLRVGDFHRWDLFPTQERRVEVPFRGEWDLNGRRLAVETAGATARWLRVRFELSDYLSRPRWRAAVEVAGMNAAPLAEAARHFGAALPAGLNLQGMLDGRILFAGSAWPEGTVRLRGGALETPGSSRVEIGSAEVVFEGGRVQLGPLAVRLEGQPLEIAAAARISPPRLEVHMTSRAGRLNSLPFLPFTSFARGQWDGRVVYIKDGSQPGSWSGSGTLTAAQWQPKGLASPVEIAHARVRWDQRALQLDQLQGTVGETTFTGSCRTTPAGSTCRLRVADLDLARLDGWLRDGRPTGRWAAWKRALGWDRSPAAAWLKSARVDGSIQVKVLQAGRWTFHHVGSTIAWKDGMLLLSALRAELGRGGAVTGAIRADFSADRPIYTVQAEARGVDLRSLAEAGVLPHNFQRGLADGNLHLRASGRTAEELRASLQVEGAFEGRAIALHDVGAETDQDAGGAFEIRALEGRFQWTRAGLQLSKLRMTLGKDVFEGSGSIGGRRPVALEMASGARRWRLLSPPAAERVATEP